MLVQGETDLLGAVVDVLAVDAAGEGLLLETLLDAGDVDILQPRRLYEAGGRAEDYRALVERFKAERSEFLGKFPSLSEEIVSAVR